MKYADLMAVMHQFRIGNIDRVDMVAAIALWQRPVKCAPANMKRAAIEGVIR